jgi:hypothetical protein
MSTYLVRGFSRSGTKSFASMLVDVDEALQDAGDVAEAITNGAYCFHASESVSVPVPDDAKGILFTDNEQLYERVPQLRPQSGRRRIVNK